MQFGLGFARFS